LIERHSKLNPEPNIIKKGLVSEKCSSILKAITYFSILLQGYGAGGCAQDATANPRCAALRCIFTAQPLIPAISTSRKKILTFSVIRQLSV
jgi:hypothetical protein